MATIPGGQFRLTAHETVNAVETRTGTGLQGAVGGYFNVEVFVGLAANAPTTAAHGFNGLAVLSPSGHELDLVSGKFAATDNGGGHDTISAFGSGETVSGGAALDTMNLYGAHDTVNGGSGNDTINVYGAHDTVNGGSGQDTIDVYGAHDTVNGGSGADTINVYGAHDGVVIGTGHDTVNVAGSHDTVSAGNGGGSLISFGGSHETFADAASSYADTVVGFNQSAGDRIQLAGTDTVAHALADSRQVNGGHDTLITLNDGSSILLKGISSINSHFFS